ncbi:hypothetical protein SDC9_172909 [bioreactor metagenome]|uniref:Uncharacterized protein n=1 Tax=bioreactor metagenome TaxID=1076179 RepID=A0A645GF17_9ZZZZ
MHRDQRRPVEDEVECAIEGSIAELVTGPTDHNDVGALGHGGAGEVDQVDTGGGQVRGDIAAAQQCCGGALEMFAQICCGGDRRSDDLVLSHLEPGRA